MNGFFGIHIAGVSASQNVLSGAEYPEIVAVVSAAGIHVGGIPFGSWSFAAGGTEYQRCGHIRFPILSFQQFDIGFVMEVIGCSFLRFQHGKVISQSVQHQGTIHNFCIGPSNIIKVFRSLFLCGSLFQGFHGCLQGRQGFIHGCLFCFFIRCHTLCCCQGFTERSPCLGSIVVLTQGGSLFDEFVQFPFVGFAFSGFRPFFQCSLRFLHSCQSCIDFFLGSSSLCLGNGCLQCCPGFRSIVVFLQLGAFFQQSIQSHSVRFGNHVQGDVGEGG